KALMEAKSHAHGKELDLKQREDQIRDWTTKLNTATSNKEYQGIVLKIGEPKIENGRTEEQILLAMDETDAKDKLHEAAKAKYRDAETALRAAEGNLASQRAALEGQMADASKLRTDLAGQVPAEALRIY